MCCFCFWRRAREGWFWYWGWLEEGGLGDDAGWWVGTVG